MNKNKKNLLITQDFDSLSGISSIGNSTLALAKQLQGAEINCSIASPMIKESQPLANGVKAEKLKNLTDLNRLVNSNDIILSITTFSSTNKPLPTYVNQLCNKNRKPFYPWVRTTYRNSLFNDLVNVSDFYQDLYIKMLVETFESEFCKKVLCVSNAVAESVEALGIPASKVRIVYNCIDKNLETPISNKVNKEIDVIFVGRLSPEKGLLFLLSAVKLVKTYKPNIKAVIIGDGNDKNSVASLIKLLDLKENVNIIPKLNNSETLEAIAKSKVLVNTSLTESLGKCIIEAMYVGTPVIVPNIEGPLEITDNGTYGHVYEMANTFDLSNKILQCLNDKDPDIMRKSEAAKAYVEKKFDLSKQAKSFITMLERDKVI